MSTKIYNGYSLAPMNVMELNAFILGFRKLAEKKSSELCAKVMANHIAFAIDELAVFGEEEFITRNLKDAKSSPNEVERKFKYSSPFVNAYMELRDRYFEVQRTSYRDSDVDLDVSAIFIPLKDRILVFFYAEKEALTELWEAQPEVSEYMYWNNVDQPEELTEEEWEERSKVWEVAGIDSKTPKEMGMEIVFNVGFPNLHNISIDDVMKEFPSFEKRLDQISWSKLYDDKFKLLKSEEDSEDIYRKVSRWMRDAEGIQALEEMKEQCKVQLINKMSKDNVRQKYEKLSLSFSE